MGRGASWSDGDIGILEAYIAQGVGPTRIHQMHPAWSLDSIKKAVSRLKKGVEMNRYKGRAVKFTGVVAESADASSSAGKSLKAMKAEAAEQGVAVHKTTIWRHLKKTKKCVRKVKTFAISTVNKGARKAFCERTLARLHLGIGRVRTRGKQPVGLSLRHVVFSDEKLFRQLHSPTTQNSRSWIPATTTKKAVAATTEGSEQLRMQCKRSPGVMVSCAVSLSTRILGPFFVDSNVKINGEVYVQVLENNYLPRLLANPEILQHGVWQEDNAPCHRSALVKEWKQANWLREISWPSTAPDLSPLDYALWGIMDSWMQRTYPQGFS
eukprot:4744817-Amphidinium_carterae.1